MHDKLVALEVLQLHLGIEILDLRGDKDLEVLERKAAELADAALADLHRGPEVGNVETDGCDDARPGHHDAACAVRVCHHLPAGCGRR